MPQAASLLPVLLALMGYAVAGLSIWPSLHVALSNASVFVEFSIKPTNSSSSSSSVGNTSLSLINTDTNTTLQTRILPNNPLSGRVEFDCSCFLYAGTFRFLLRHTSTIAVSPANSTESTTWWWSSELQVQWPTFHIAVERDGNRLGSFQVRISTSEYFQACSHGLDSALFLEVSYVEHNQIGRNSIDKVRARTRRPVEPVRSQSVALPCAFPFTERDFIRVALHSPHASREVKSSGPLYPSRVFSYKLQVANANAHKSGCDGAVAVKLIAPPCVHVSGKVLLYKDAAVSAGAGGTAPMEPSSPPLAFNWLTQGENETEFNCSVFEPGRNKYCFRFVFNFSRSPSPAQICLVVHKREESWGPWQPWTVCSVSCGEGVRERTRECLLPSSVGRMQCTGMVKEQSMCSLEDCAVLPGPSPSLPPIMIGGAPLGGNMVVVAGISLCLAVIFATVVVTVWRKVCRTPQCSSVRRGSAHSPGGRKLSDEASICGHSLQRPSLTDGHGKPGSTDVGIAQKDGPFLGSQPLPQTVVLPLPQQDPERLSPTGQKMLPPSFGYRLAQQQLKEMKKKGLKEATQLYHVSSSPVHDVVTETSALPTASSPIPSPAGFTHSALDDINHGRFRIAAAFSEPASQTSERPSPRADAVLAPPVSASSKRRDRTAQWVEMVERSGLAGDVLNHKNPHFRRTSSFNDSKHPSPQSAQSRYFRERSMTQVGSRTLPEGSSWTRGGWERQPYHNHPIPEHGPSEWTKPRPTSVSDLKHTGASQERQRSAEHDRGAKEGVSGIGGPASGLGANQLGIERAERAEQNWNRRGPSPIQRNILARKLKEAQSGSGVKGRQRSSTFSAPTPSSSGDYSGCSAGSPFRLSEAERRAMDVDAASSFVGE